MGILRVIINRNSPCRMMVHTHASKAASFSAACRAPLQEAQDLESKPEV
jgi:hypothetical protein